MRFTNVPHFLLPTKLKEFLFFKFHCHQFFTKNRKNRLPNNTKKMTPFWTFLTKKVFFSLFGFTWVLLWCPKKASPNREITPLRGFRGKNTTFLHAFLYQKNTVLRCLSFLTPQKGGGPFFQFLTQKIDKNVSFFDF